LESNATEFDQKHLKIKASILPIFAIHTENFIQDYFDQIDLAARISNFRHFSSFAAES
jgi:hypothetical protein